MNNLTLDIKTMSSVEIAELTGKRHTHVIRDIESMLKELELGEPKFGSSYISSQNKELKCYNLPKRECVILVSGYSVKMRAKIVDRWQELENTVEPLQTLLSSEETRLKALDLMSKLFNVQGTERIKMFESGLSLEYPALANALPSYNATKHEGTIGEVSERVSHSFTYHREAHSFELRAAEFNKLAISAGYLQNETTSSGKTFKSITQKGLKYGKNLAPKQASSQTQPHWYDDTILEFYTLVVNSKYELGL